MHAPLTCTCLDQDRLEDVVGFSMTEDEMVASLAKPPSVEEQEILRTLAETDSASQTPNTNASVTPAQEKKRPAEHRDERHTSSSSGGHMYRTTFFAVLPKAQFTYCGFFLFYVMETIFLPLWEKGLESCWKITSSPW